MLYPIELWVRGHTSEVHPKGGFGASRPIVYPDGPGWQRSGKVDTMAFMWHAACSVCPGPESGCQFGNCWKGPRGQYDQAKARSSSGEWRTDFWRRRSRIGP